MNARILAIVAAAAAVAAGCETTSTRQTDTYSSTTRTETQAQSTRQNRVFGFNEAAFPTGEERSSLVQITAEPGAPEARVGQPFPYTIKVTNLSRDLTLDNVRVMQDIPGQFRVVESQPAPATREGGTAGGWNVGQLAPGESKTISVSLVPQEPGRFDSCFRVAYEPVLCTTINVVAPALALDMQAPERANLCDPIPVRVRVRNTGTGSTDPVQVRLMTPQGLTASQTDTTPQGAQGGRLAMEAGQLQAGDTREFTFNLKPDKPGRYTITAAADSPGGMKAQSPETTIEVVAAQLETTLEGPQDGFVGENAPYRVVVANRGNGPAERAQLKLTFDRAARVVQPASRTEDSSTVIDLGTIGPGEQRETPILLFTRDEGPMRIRAEATARCAQTRPAELATAFTAVPALQLEAVDTTDPVRVGQDEVYKITVLNQGTGADRDIVVEAVLPPVFEFVSVTGPTPGRNEDGRIRFGIVPTLGPGERAVWLVTLHAVRAGDIRFEVHATSNSIKEPAVKMEPTRVY